MIAAIRIIPMLFDLLGGDTHPLMIFTPKGIDLTISIGEQTRGSANGVRIGSLKKNQNG